VGLEPTTRGSRDPSVQSLEVGVRRLTVRSGSDLGGGAGNDTIGGGAGDDRVKGEPTLTLTLLCIHNRRDRQPGHRIVDWSRHRFAAWHGGHFGSPAADVLVTGIRLLRSPHRVAESRDHGQTG